jgi:hypothetical protein
MTRILITTKSFPWPPRRYMWRTRTSVPRAYIGGASLSLLTYRMFPFLKVATSRIKTFTKNCGHVTLFEVDYEAVSRTWRPFHLFGMPSLCVIFPFAFKIMQVECDETHFSYIRSRRSFCDATILEHGKCHSNCILIEGRVTQASIHTLHMSTASHIVNMLLKAGVSPVRWTTTWHSLWNGGLSLVVWLTPRSLLSICRPRWPPM